MLDKLTVGKVVSDLFADIKKGHVLLDLLEVLSGQQLIEELARTLSCNCNQPSLDSVSVVDSSPTSSPPAKKCSKVQERWQMSAKKALLQWAQEQCATFESVRVTDFKASWRNGMAFLAVIHALRPDLIDMKRVKHRSNRDNLNEAFRIAERELKIPKMLEPEDVDVVNPDEKSIMTYVAQFLQYSKDAPGTGDKAQGKVKDAMVWLTLQEKKLQKMLTDSENETYCKKYEINVWKTELNHVLPSPLYQIETWLQGLEELIDEDLPASQDYYEAMALMQEKMTLFQEMNLPLIKKQDEPFLDNSGNTQLSKEENLTADLSTDMSIELPENCSQNIMAGEEHEKENEEFTGALKVAEEVEKLVGQVEIWEAETTSVLDLLRQQGDVDTSVEESLQHLIAKGSMYEELVSRTEDTLQMDVQNVSSQESLQHVITAGLQAKIQEAKEKVQEALIIFNTKSLAKYLKAVEELKNNVTEDVKLSLEEESRDICAKWEACFSEEGSLYQLDHHMDVLRELCEELTSQKSQQEVRRVLKDYEQKIERLRKCASEIHMTLQPTVGGTSKNKGTADTSENGGRNALSEVPSAKSDNQPSAEKAMESIKDFSLESKLKPQQEESVMEKYEKDHSASINSLLERYDTHRDNLELHLQNSIVRIISDFSSDKERSSVCLQDKLTDLQVLKNETDACWKEFEVTSLKLEELESDIRKPFLVKARDKLKEKERELQMTLNTRMESLETALHIVLPVEKELLLLCDSDLLLCEMAIQEFNLTDADDIYRNLRNIQDSIVKQIEICNHLEQSGNFALKELNPLDLHAAQNIILKHRTQLEEMNHKVQRSKDALKVLEDFLASLRGAELSGELLIDLSASGSQVVPGSTLTVENKEGRIHQMKDKARHLDERLKVLGISVKDAEQGENTSCEKLLNALSRSLSETHGSGRQEELTEEDELLETCIFKNNELLKNIQDVHNQISKIGLKDPTVPAVKQRLDQCERVLELLKQYQNFKSVLTTLIQKEENIISLQASYMGKENLKKRIAEIEVVKEEFNEHLEVVDKINQICKNLQFHLNKMRNFEEPPFEKEANIIVDRWLDINEKTEDYYENLGRALALWDKLFNLKNGIDEWTEKILQKMELHQLTEEEREKLKEELQVHEQKPSEFSKRVAKIQFLLQSSEIPLELQVMESSILNKIEHVKMRLTGESNCSALGGSTAELREDLHQAKTQIGMTESLLNALSPSDSLEIFTKLEDFLTLEGRGSEIQQVGTVLNHVKNHLPKAPVKKLNSWIVSQEIELEKMESICQARAKELDECLQQLLREQFESMAQLNNSVKEYGITEEEEIVTESTHLINRYQTLLGQLCEIDEEDKLPPAKDQSFNDLAHDVIRWITGIKESLMVLNSSEGKMPLEERIQKIKEIILLKPEGDAKIQTIVSQAESSKAPMVPKTLTDIKSQWDNTLHLANTYLSHQEKLLLEGEKYLQSKEDLRLMLTELKKKQEVGFALQHGLQEKKAQLKIYKKFLQKAQDLTSLLEELKSQGNYLLECTKNPNFSEEPWLEIKHLHESLLQQLQESVQKLEGHVQEHDSYQVCITDLNTALDYISKEFVGFSDKPVDQIAIEEKMQKLQELENSLRLQDGTLEKILALAKSIKQNTSSVGQKIIKDDIKSLKCKQKDLENRLESAKQEMENCLNSILKSKCSTEKKEKFPLPGREEQVTSDVQESTQDSAAVEKLEEDWEINKNSAVEMVLSKQLPLDVQESMKTTEDEQKVNELQNQPLELDVMLRNEQLKEIEELCTQLEAKKAAIEPLGQIEYLKKAETSALFPHSERYSVQHLDNLLQALITLKKKKESQYCLLKDFQEHLAAVESSMKAFLTEKESLKVGPLDSATYMDKIKKLLASIEKEKDSLSKMKIKWENLSNCLTDMDKKLLESQTKQLEHGWEQMEQLVQKKYSQQVVGHDEFTFLMSKIQDLEISLQQQQQCLQLRLDSPEEEGNQSMVALATELQTIKHRFSVFKGRAELQMKRIWGEKEKKILEDAINNLQKQLEALEPLNIEVENQIKKCETRYKMKEAILWVKNLLGELVPTISLLPDNILSQIRKCKVVHDDILDKQQVVESLVEEVKDNIPNLTAYESSDLNNLLQDLQNQYQMLVLKSTQRSQQLEFKLEERSKFVGVIGKVQLSLQGNETLMIPKMETTSTEAELEHQYVTLTISQKELQEIESVIATHLQEQTNICKDLSVFERLFLDDQLKNLKTRANRTQRFIQNKCNEVEHKINFYREFHEKTSVLQKEVDHIQHNELLLNPEINPDVKEELYRLKDQITGIRSSILQVLKLKEVFDCMGLNWDWSQLDQLQTQILEKEKELEEKIKQLDTFVAEYGKYQASLGKLRAMDLQVKKRAEALLTTPNTPPESSLLNAQILNQRIRKVMCLYHEIIKKLSENKDFDDSFKEKEVLQIKLYAEENDKLHKVLQNIVLESQPKEMDEKNFQDKLENSLRVLDQIKSQLQQPLLINLQIEHIQNEKVNCEMFQEQVQAEMDSIKAVTVLEKQREEDSSEASDVETKLHDIEDLHMQLNASIDSRTNVLNDAYENMACYNEAVSRAMEIITALEAIIASHRVDLDNPEESIEMPRCKQEELKSTIADIQDLTENLGTISSPEAKRQLECTLQELVSKNSAMREAAKVKEAEVERCLENYKGYRKIKEKICTNLSQMETVLGQSMSPLPVSYKEALERLEQSKALVSNLTSAKEELMKVRRVLRHLRPTCTDSDSLCFLRSTSALWERWLNLMEAVKEWELWCEELKQEWKFIHEEIEREAIILDNLQEELPEISKTKEAATTEEFSELLDCLCQYEENVERQQLLLALLLQRIKNIQNTPEGLRAVETVSASQEIMSMQERCNKLFQKAQKNKELMQNEIQERHAFTKEIITLKNSFQQTTTFFQNMELQDHPEKAEQLEELQSILKKGKLTFENIMEKLRIKYSEMYTIVPAEIESQVEECRKALEDVDEKISNEVLKSSPSYSMSRKIDEINNGLRNVEKMLQQKSKNIEKAQEIQKTMWDELDLWHSKLNELDSEVQDIVEQDPGQAQEWMDNLMIPFQQYQQVSQRAEYRTSQLNKATIKLEEYHDLLKSTEAWIENTSRLLADPADYDSSKTLSHHASTLQMALEDSEQKHNLLHSIFTDLEDLSIIFETDTLAQPIQELSHQIVALRQKIIESLPQIQRMADDVVAIETEVKSMEKRVSKIKAILLSKEIFDFSPEEHLKHGEVILENIHPMKKTIAEIVSYQVELRLPQTGMKPLPVFQRTNQLLQDIKLLENVTQEQNELLKGEIEGTEKQILSLNQKKEDLLVDLKAAILKLHQHFQQKQQELEKEMLSAAASDEDGGAERDASEWKLNRTGSMFFLPAVEEEAEEISLKSESGDKKAEPSSGSPSLLWKHDEDVEEDRASSSSGTMVQEAARKISMCDSSMAQIFAQDSLNTEQGPEFSLSPNQTQEGTTPPIKVSAPGFSDEQGAFEATVEKARPKPAEVLHVCKNQVAELELWLQQANVAFEPETLDADMQQAVEQQLVGCQAMLTEIEHKVASLLENCKDQGLADSGATQQEAEALSLKLKTVKCNLEKVQMMLQEKYSENQHSAMLKKSSEHQKVLQPDNLSEFESIVTERPQFSRQKDFQQQQENVSEETYANLDKKLLELFLTLSQCLGSVEEMLQTPWLLRGDVGAQQVHYETLALELKKLCLAMSDKKNDISKAMTWPGKNASLFLDCFDNLQVYLEHIQATTASRSKSLKAGLDYNRSYQNEIKRLYDQLTKNKTSLQQSLNEISGQSIDEQLQKADACTVELQNSESRVAKLRDEGERLHLPSVLLQEVYKLEDVLDRMWGILRARYTKLSSPFITESQQDALLRGMVELVNIGKENLAHDRLQQTKSKVALQAQIQNHKKWEEFDENYASLEKDLEILVSTLPSVSLVEETEERLMERISFYQPVESGRQKELQLGVVERASEQIKRNIDEKHARLYQTVNEGKQLVVSVSCPELEGQIAKLEEQWLSLNKKIDHELHRLQTLLKHLLSYNRDSDQLTKWLESSQQTLNYWKEQSLNVSQDLDTIRSNINNFFEFSKELDEKSSLKTAVLSTGNQLLHLKEADTATLRASLAQFEQKWTMLITQLPDIQEKLHQLQMEKLPSRKAITEMINWMSNVEHQTADEDSGHSLSSASQVRNLLHKYKEFRMEMDYKQWIVDFVNQSLLQLSTCDVESKRYERTEFAEHLGEMNHQWHRVHGTLNGKIQQLEQLLESITENENKIQILNNWMEAQEERLNTLQKPESVISVQKTLLDCQDIENQLAIKSKALDELRQSHLTSESGTMPLLEDTASKIEELFQKKNSVINQVNELKTSMQSVLQEWKIYDKLYDEVNMMTIRFWYCMEHSKPVVLSLEALRCQVQNLQTLQDEAESSEGSWKKLQEVIGKLKDYCPSVAEIIQEKCQNTHTRWTQVNQDIADQLQRAQSPLQLWKAYNTAHAEAAARLEQQEAKYQQLANINTSGNNLAEILPPALRDVKELQHDVQKTKEAFLQDSTLLDRLPQPAEPNTHLLLSGQMHSLQRASYLEKMLLMKTNEFKFVLSQFKDFGDQLDSLKGLITHEEENLDKLYQQEKEGNPDLFLNHVLALTAQSPYIEHLNEVSLKLPLSDVAVKTLQNVNRQWIRATATALERCRPEFVWKFTRLKERWQSAAQGVRQRKSDIDELVSQWQYFTTSEGDLLHLLAYTSHLLSAVKSQDCYSLHQTRSLIHELKNKEVHFQRWQTTYALTLEAGGKLLNTTHLETKESIDKRISQLQDNWKDTKLQLGEMIKQFQSIAETWDQCEKKIKELRNRLQVLKAQSKDPLPELHEELHREKELIKELEKSLANWTQNLKELHTMKTDLTQHILVEDVMVLKEQIEHLHRQWEDLCLRVAIRKQEIEDRLNSWIVFNEKNKELCAWLVQMENKVLQTADISIEEMIEKLQKDCMEEINLFSENKLQLKQMGDRLINASNKTRAAEIDDKLNKINDRWQHLFDVIGSRVKKLKETFAFIQQLDKNMSNLRTWLARIESELSKPVVYDVCDDQEIQKRLAEQQDLQRDIEQHSAGVESVFNICDVLLHDSDACANETECDSIQQTTRSLDRRWRNICAMSMERRMKIEETWRLWQKFLDDYSRFEDWLKSAERTAACPNSSEVLYTVAKEELKRLEAVNLKVCSSVVSEERAFQRQIHERLTQLELINKQYRRLARENRTDTASKLKQMVHEGNQRWDNLQKRVTAILRRLRHFTNQREEFEGTRESILVWLTEMDLQLTNVEHFSESDADDKMRQLNGFQQEITLNTNKIDQLIVFGEQLIQKSEPLDAVLIEDELEELHRYCQEVFGRVSRFHRRLTSHASGLEDEKEASENETDVEDPREIQDDSWRKRRESEEPSSPQSLCHLVPPAPGPERSGCETPVSVDSIPLEWDHTGDVGGSSSHEEDEEGPYYSALSGKSISEGHSWHVPDSPPCRKRRYKQMGGDRNVQPIPSDSSTPYKPAYVKLLLSPGTEGGKEEPRVPTGSPQQEDEGLASLTGQQSGAFDRWQLIQAQELDSKLRIKQNLQRLNSDISDITTWLEKTEAELETLKLAKPPSGMQEMGLRVKRLKEILKAFDTHKALVVSVNVSSKEFLQAESTDSKELQDRVGQLRLRWDAAQGAVESWREGLRLSLMQCQDFHQLSQSLLLWLASAESRRQKARVTDPEADPRPLLACREELLQLEKELVERQPQVNSLQEISSSLLIKGHREDYIEAEEKVHVIEKKLKQLLEQVSQDLVSLQRSQNPDSPLPSLDEADPGEPPATPLPAPQAKVLMFVFTQAGGVRSREWGLPPEPPDQLSTSSVARAPSPAGPESSRPARSFVSRVIRAALPLQLLLLLLLFLACLLPSSEEDYSCTQANNFARSFYPMLRYTNGPPPT
ncbi:hypothetical protein J1605_000365 [Eschrichtius robustus]|uniref:Nesprin-2 n=1 Tax=Eschrichtius robustus TaxID=9764 RepID=A0AB34H9S0_ESCRO|nr:hypothetical protein J1605_000365 [Eschrichtius robustus]